MPIYSAPPPYCDMTLPDCERTPMNGVLLQLTVEGPKLLQFVVNTQSSANYSVKIASYLFLFFVFISVIWHAKALSNGLSEAHIKNVQGNLLKLNQWSLTRQGARIYTTRTEFQPKTGHCSEVCPTTAGWRSAPGKHFFSFKICIKMLLYLKKLNITRTRMPGKYI